MGYGYGYKAGEHWATQEAYLKQLARARENAKKQRQKPGYREAFNEYIKTRYPNIEMRRQKTSERGKRWRAANKARNAQKTRYRYALKKARIHPELDRHVERELFAAAARLTRETGVEHHVDHIIPLRAGGWHHHMNLQILPEQVNYDKWAKPFWEMPGYKSWRDVPEWLWPESLAPAYHDKLLRSA